MSLKKIIPLLLVLPLVLAACRGAAEAELTPTPPPADTTVSIPEVSTPRPSPVVSGALASCTVVSQPDNSEIEELFPPVSENDWVKGPETARITILEYSDFQ
jgi:hypothetical protein